MPTIFDDFVALAFLLFVVLFYYAKAKNKSLKEVVTEIREAFSYGEEEE